jgi:hypothetical protein
MGGLPSVNMSTASFNGDRPPRALSLRKPGFDEAQLAGRPTLTPRNSLWKPLANNGA